MKIENLSFQRNRGTCWDGCLSAPSVLWERSFCPSEPAIISAEQAQQAHATCMKKPSGHRTFIGDRMGQVPSQ